MQPDHRKDLTSPASWYVAARKQRRRIVLHLGPANSGKTFQALEVLKQAKKGVYCGPLRLLAAEVADKVNAAGIACSLLTGQEQRKVAGANHLACTVEMASTTKPVDVAVIDEVQMLADKHRGHAFTRALLGVPAREVHVCGDPAALPLLEKILQETGEEVELREYSRLSALKVSRRSLGGLHKVRRGDCVVAFSRKQVHLLRRQIEAQGGRGCCVVYGALPPESRRQQAALFNTPRTGFNILAASDAVGMGLNLNIGRIVFATMDKFDGVETRPLTVSETKQIAGRAGRYGSKFSKGIVTTLDPEDLPILRHAVASPTPELEAACLFPRFEQLATFAGQHPHMRFSDVLQAFAEQASLRPHYFFGSAETMHQLAMMLDHLPLSLPDRYTFVTAPADPADPTVASAFLSFASRFCHRRSVPIALVSIPQIDASLEAFK
ncbi:hypothetical protein WJX73_006619 [Symbiochloris irregularis]|uniref:RNA helicase n=1 Tax=Symbiochloris irregularis TaxID=706552 RepID=A0AAW1PJG4_9CHLO